MKSSEIGFLVIKVRPGDTIKIGGVIEIDFKKALHQVSIGIAAPKGIAIERIREDGTSYREKKK